MADCKEKWRSVRGRYLRQLKEIPSSGSAAKSKKVYYLTEYLGFLEPFTKSRSQTGNLLTENSEDESVNEELELEVEEDINMPCTSQASTITSKFAKKSKTKKTNLSPQDELNIVAAEYFNNKRKLI